MKNKDNPFYKDYVNSDLKYKHFEFIQWFTSAVVDDVYCDIIEDVFGELEVLSEWALNTKMDYKSSDIVSVWLEYRQSKYTPRFADSKMRSLVLAKCEYKCSKCGATENLHIDHIYPYSKGGKTVYNNLTVLCESCNKSKSDRV